MLSAEKWLKKYNCLMVLVLLPCLGFAAAPGEMRATPVQVEAVQLRTMAPVSWVAGGVVSRNEARMAAEVSGRLLEVVEEGSVVKKGQAVARIDDVLIRADLAEAEAEVAREEANLNFLKREVDRLLRLAKQNNAAQTQLDQTRAERDATVSELAAAKARLHIAKERVARSVVKAPFAGVVVLRLKRTGEWIDSGEEVVQLVDPNSLEVEATASLTLMPYLAGGQMLDIQSGQHASKGKLRAVVPVADPQSRLMRLRLDIVEGAWSAGQPLRVALPTALAQEVMTVPRDALVLRRGGSFVYKVGEDNVAQRVNVEPGMAVGPYIEVLGDLQPGDKVVTRGNERLRPGMTVSFGAGETK